MSYTVEDDNKLLRKLLWLNHGCERGILYGDDGEMQCPKCLIDFKRLPAYDIQTIFVRNAILRIIPV